MTDVQNHLHDSERDVAVVPLPHPRRAVVVGADGSDPNQAAVRWATYEAEASNRPLNLICVEEADVLSPRHDGVPDAHLTVLGLVAEDIARHRPELTVHHESAVGNPVTTLLARSADQGLLVVGQRGLGTFARLLIGSTSIAVAGRSQVPVVIVPDTWEQGTRRHEPVVVGMDPDDLHTSALSYAFAEARRRGVGLVVAYGWEPKGLVLRDPAAVSAEIADWKTHSMARLNDAVAPLQIAFAGVHVELRPTRGHPATVLLDAAGSAQLLVLGRHDDGRLGGFPYGSVTRNVLHHACVPVAVVPSGGER